MNGEEIPREFTGVWFPRAVWLNPKINCVTRCLLAEIHALGGHRGECTASNEFLGKHVDGVGARQVSNMIATLIDQKLVKQVFFDGRTRKLKTLFELSDSDNPPSKKVPGSLENAKQPSKKVPSTPEENIPPYRSKKKERDSSGKPESLEEVQGYAKELNADGEEAEKFFDHFTSNGWKVGGRTAMQDWRAAFRNWMRNSVKFGGKKPEKVTEDGLEDTSHYPDHRGLRPGIDFDRPDGKY